MTEPLAHTLTPEEADALREYAATDNPFTAGEVWQVDSTRVWSPIEIVEATGKARCRSCSEPIEKGERCIRFSFDPYGDGNWGRLAAAYLHLAPCEGGTP